MADATHVVGEVNYQIGNAFFFSKMRISPVYQGTSKD